MKLLEQRIFKNIVKFVPTLLSVAFLTVVYSSQANAWGHNCVCSCKLSTSPGAQVETHGNSGWTINKLWVADKNNSASCMKACQERYPRTTQSATLSNCKFAW